MEPRFQPGDLVFFDQSEPARIELDSKSVYLVTFENKEYARYVRKGGNRLYLACEESLLKPSEWDFVTLADKTILEVVRGRIVWICRQVEKPEAILF